MMLIKQLLLIIVYKLFHFEEYFISGSTEVDIPQLLVCIFSDVCLFPRTSCLWRDVSDGAVFFFKDLYYQGSLIEDDVTLLTATQWLQWHLDHKPCLMFYVENLLVINTAFTPKVKTSSCLSTFDPPTSTF